MITATSAAGGELRLAEAVGLAPAAVLSRLGSSTDGLSSDEAADRLRRFGPNALGTHRVRASAVVFRQIRNPILILLLAAALVSGLTGGGTNAVIIAVIVALSVGLGFFNEYRAEMAMAALRAKIRHEAEVRRDGQLVPGPGHGPGARRRGVAAHRRPRAGRPPLADRRRTRVRRRRADRRVDAGGQVGGARRRPPEPQDQPGCAFMGTIVHQGSALGVVVRTGARTAFGQIAAGLAEKHGQTAFEVGLSRFSRFLFAVAAVLTAFIFIVNVALSRPLDRRAALLAGHRRGHRPRDDAGHRDREPVRRARRPSRRRRCW